MNDRTSRVGEDNELQLDDGNNGGHDTGKKHKGKKKKRGPAFKFHDVEYLPHKEPTHVLLLFLLMPTQD
jgi:hypothetical protein